MNPDLVANLAFDLDKSASFNIITTRCCYVGGLEAKLKDVTAAKNVDWSMIAGYSNKNLDLMAKFNKLDSCTLSAYHQYSGALALGTVASVDIGAIRAKGTGNAVTDLKLGAKYNIDSVSDCAAQRRKTRTRWRQLYARDSWRSARRHVLADGMARRNWMIN